MNLKKLNTKVVPQNIKMVLKLRNYHGHFCIKQFNDKTNGTTIFQPKNHQGAVTNNVSLQSRGQRPLFLFYVIMRNLFGNVEGKKAALAFEVKF